MTSLIDFPNIIDGEDKACPLKNRIRNNYRHVRKWAKRTNTDCFRIYDHEVREFPLAIDYYAGRYCVHYFADRREGDEPPAALVRKVNETLASLFGAVEEAVFWRSRIRRARTEQYEKLTEDQDFFVVREYGVPFWVNLVSYLDTGLFLDHRETRQMVAAACPGKRLLNLFAYTCSFSVHAAVAGATFTKSVDLSNTYTKWGRRNFELNGIKTENHPIVRADCAKFLYDEARSGMKYDVIIIDPPTLSRSKKLTEMFDIQVDYVMLIEYALKLLADGGTLFFSTNSRKFKLDATLFEGWKFEDISSKTLPVDFYDPKIHRCWRIRRDTLRA